MVAPPVLGREEDFWLLEFGEPRPRVRAPREMPLPPTCSGRPRSMTASLPDRIRAGAGAVAAPTPGLHFDEALLAACEQAGVGRAWVTLHVGAGTFQRARRRAWPAPHARRARGGPARDLRGRARVPGAAVASWRRYDRRARLETAAGAGHSRLLSATRAYSSPRATASGGDALVTNFHLPNPRC